MTVNLRDRERKVLASLLATLRPWVEGVRADEPLSGVDLVDDLCAWVWSKDIGPRLLDGLCEKLRKEGT